MAANHITDFKRDGPGTVRYDAIERFAEHFRVVRYDHRGTGSSERNVQRQGQEAWIEDLEAVVRAAAPSEPVVLVAVSQASPYGAAFAAQHPDLVSHLVLYGAFNAGANAGGLAEERDRSKAMLELVRLDWDRPNPSGRSLVFASLFPEPRPQELAWQEVFPLMVSRDDALRFLEASADQDARPMLPQISTPTLVMATADDKIVLPEWCRAVAAAIPDAVYVELPGHNHIPLKHDPSWEPYFEHVMGFVTAPQPPSDRLADLSPRERDILDGVCEGLSNEAIALQRNISPKTVRNHLSRIFDKLRVRSRTQAALAATRA
jgi:pimeloyl-ACP methyl ester carboxylesterase/DNA-binding CsgD family transcriptional regulator